MFLRGGRGMMSITIVVVNTSYIGVEISSGASLKRRFSFGQIPSTKSV